MWQGPGRGIVCYHCIDKHATASDASTIHIHDGACGDNVVGYSSKPAILAESVPVTH